MASGGGATAQSTIEPYQKEFHGLILRGIGGYSIKNWEGQVQSGALGMASATTAGTGYSVDDILTLLAGANTGTVRVTAVNGTGGVTSCSVETEGGGYTEGTEYSTSGGGGSGAKITVLATAVLPYESGATYEEEPSILRFIIDKGLTAKGGNPYSGKLSYAPDLDINTAQADVTSFGNQVTTMAPQTDWGNFVSTAAAQIDTIMQSYSSDDMFLEASQDALQETSKAFLQARNDVVNSNTFTMTAAIQQAIAMLNSGVIMNAVDAFRKQALRGHLRSVNRFAGGMAEIGAVNSSAFALGMAMLESDFEASVNDFASKLSLSVVDQFVQLYSQHLATFMQLYRVGADSHLNASFREHALIQDATKDLTSLYLASIEARKGKAVLQTELSRIKIVAKGEESEKNLDIAAKDKLWDLSLFQNAGNVLSAVSGGTVMVPQGPSRAQSAIGGALAGAAQAAAISGGNPLITGVGALGGLVAGL